MESMESGKFGIRMNEETFRGRGRIDFYMYRLLWYCGDSDCFSRHNALSRFDCSDSTLKFPRRSPIHGVGA